jgi:hypothetical protein
MSSVIVNTQDGTWYVCDEVPRKVWRQWEQGEANVIPMSGWCALDFAAMHSMSPAEVIQWSGWALAATEWRPTEYNRKNFGWMDGGDLE